jgi:hypothetical protein
MGRYGAGFAPPRHAPIRLETCPKKPAYCPAPSASTGTHLTRPDGYPTRSDSVFFFWAWAKWRRRLPRVIAVLRQMRDFYMDISFHFESSVIPFVGKIAPSDAYKIWKRDGNLRADTSRLRWLEKPSSSEKQTGGAKRKPRASESGKLGFTKSTT